MLKIVTYRGIHSYTIIFQRITLTIRVLNTGVVNLSTDTIDNNDLFNESEISNNVLIIGMANSKRIEDQWDSP